MITYPRAILIAFCLLSLSWALPATAEDTVTYVEPTAADKALAEKLAAVTVAAKGTPGQEPTNWLLSGWPAAIPKWLKGDKPATAEQLTMARNKVKSIIAQAEAGTNWPVDKSIKIPFAKTAPKIDGMLDDAVWKTAVRFDQIYPFGEREAAGPATTWYVAWDTSHLYFAFDCSDSDIIAPKMERDDHVYFHDCVEMFVMPEFRTGVYWELVISPSGSVYDGLNAKKFGGWGAIAQKEQNIAKLQVGQQVKGTIDKSDDKDGGYSVEVAIPFSELPSYTRGNAPEPGQTIHFTLVRLDKNGKTMKTYAFQPLISWGHNVWNHVTATLDK